MWESLILPHDEVGTAGEGLAGFFEKIYSSLHSPKYYRPSHQSPVPNLMTDHFSRVE